MGSILAGRNIWHTAAAISGATAVGLGAYGAHKFKPSDPKWVVVYQRGSEYHLIHTLLLAGAPLARRPNVVGGLALTGVVLFSGSCYAAALTEDRSNSMFAPFGGFALIGAWLALAL